MDHLDIRSCYAIRSIRATNSYRARPGTAKATMQEETIVKALILGILEGLTEFIPVSSTGHLLLAGHFLGFESSGKTFEVLIQLGAILAIVIIQRRTALWNPRNSKFVERIQAIRVFSPILTMARCHPFSLGFRT